MSDAARFKETASAYDLPVPTFDASLTEVGRGTAMGELFRRYWHPVYKSDKLTDLPVRIRALGEDLVLFRKTSGEPGLVYPRCVHRGADLFFGKVTEKGIRCCYHGWTFETDGRCVSQPCEPDDGGKGKNAVRQPWYPVAERYGFVFAYLGPLDRKPPLPKYDLLEAIPDGWEIVADDTSIPSGGAGYLPCNWLQHHENGIDPAHVPIVHEHQFPPMMAQAQMTATFETKDDRIFSNGVFKLEGMMMNFDVEIIVPNIRVIPSPLLPVPRPDSKSDQISWTLPKDDTDTIVFTAIVQPVGQEPFGGELYDGKAWADLTDEEHQRFPGDFEAQVGQGPITLHSEEHLVSWDKGIVLLRRQLAAAAKTVAEGGNPPLTLGANEILVETAAGFRMLPNPDYVPPAADDTVSTLVAAAAGVDGRWLLTMTTPMGEQQVTLTCAASGNALTGMMSGGEGDVAIANGRVSGNRLTWDSRITKPMAMTLKYDVIVESDRLSGTFKPGLFPKAKVSGVRG
jgi:phenylpropionate dioxygenase-like ring-hydroxylating dioxygenase large terminal subunit